MHTMQVKSWKHMLQTNKPTAATTTTAFKSQQKNKTWKIFHNTDCKTEYVIYLMEFAISNLQYVGKTRHYSTLD